jgi:urease accessory protein
MSAKTILIGALVVVCLLAEPAFAHHPMGGLTPATFADGLLSGLGHPVIGLDQQQPLCPGQRDLVVRLGQC